MCGTGEAVLVAAPGVDQGPILGGERKERGEFECPEFAQNLPDAKIC